MIRTGGRLWTLGVDQAATSGWCLHEGTTPRAWGEAKTARERRDAVALAARLSGCNNTCSTQSWFTFVFENHAGFFAKNGRGHAALMGALYRWHEQLDLIDHPEDFRMGLTPDQWQTRVLGLKKRTIKRAERKAQARFWASAHVQERITSEDVADAIAISACGAMLCAGRFVR